MPEILTVIAIVVLVTVVSMPAIDVFFNSFASQGSTEAMINAALSSARAMATSEHRYVGIRFQKIYDERGPLYADQYMIFIVYDYDKTKLAYGFRAVEGIKPMKLPENIGAMEIVADDTEIDNEAKVKDKTTFSIVFSPSGKMVVHLVRVASNNVKDMVFDQMPHQYAMFQEDEDVTPPYKQEPSRRSFLIYDNREFRRAYDNDRPYTDYLKQLAEKPLYINPYTGTIISQGQ